MASARSRLGAARRSLIKRQKKTDLLSGILGTASTVAAFAGTQAKKAKTAWEEYEAGYKAIGGDPTDILKRGGFFKQLGQTLVPGGDKGFFQGPEGEVTIGDKIYDRSKIRKAGAFLGSEAATALFAGEGGEDIQKKYLQRTAPGRWAPDSFDKPTAGPHMVATDMDVTERVSDRYDYRGYQKMFLGSENILNKEDYDRMNAANLRKIELSKYTQPIDEGLQIPEQNLSIPALSSEEVGLKKAQEQQWRLDRIPSSTSYERSQEQFYKEDPYRERIDSPYNSPWKSWEEQ